MSFEIAKAGWLFRQSSVLRRWKRAWFVLYTDGILKFFESPDSHVAEEAILLPAKCTIIKSATQVAGIAPPTGMYSHSLLQVVMNNGDAWVLCAESADDMKAWEIALNEARVIRMRSGHNPDNPPPYSVAGYPGQQFPPYSYSTVTTGSGYETPGYQTQGQVYYGTHPPPYVVQQPPGQTTIIYADQQPGYYRRGYDGSDAAMGIVAGAALGSMMWGPLLWW